MESIIGLFKTEASPRPSSTTAPTRPSPTSSTPPPAGSTGTTTDACTLPRDVTPAEYEQAHYAALNREPHPHESGREPVTVHRAAYRMLHPRHLPLDPARPATYLVDPTGTHHAHRVDSARPARRVATKPRTPPPAGLQACPRWWSRDGRRATSSTNGVAAVSRTTTATTRPPSRDRNHSEHPRQRRARAGPAGHRAAAHDGEPTTSLVHRGPSPPPTASCRQRVSRRSRSDLLDQRWLRSPRPAVATSSTNGGRDLLDQRWSRPPRHEWWLRLPRRAVVAASSTSGRRPLQRRVTTIRAPLSGRW